MVDFGPHVFATSIGQDLILFDTRADRYQAMPGAVDVRAGRPFDAPSLLLPEAVEALRAAGLMVDRAAARARVRIAQPDLVHRSDPAVSPVSLLDLWRFAASLAGTGWRLWQGRSCSAFASTRTTMAAGSEGVTGADLISDDLANALRRLCTLRLIIPSPRRCLPASLVAASFLQRFGQPVDIVFGVRSHPFAAHCWVEANGVVLDDDLDRVRGFHPIAVGHL